MSLGRLNNKLETAEGGIWWSQNRAIEIILSEKQSEEKRLGKIKQSLKDLSDNITSNI